MHSKIFLLGDFQSDNGPGMANKQILSSLSRGYTVCYSKARSKIGRTIEVLKKIVASDIIVICSKSQINYLVIRLAKLFHKKSYYIMHGCSSFEAKLNNPNISKRKLQSLMDYERLIVVNTDKTICVSEFFMNFMKRRMPEYKDKFAYIYNCIDMKRIKTQACPHDVRLSQIASIGGGMKHKNILTISEAAQKLKPVLPVVVIGADGEDSVAIKAQSNTEWNGLMTHSDVIKVLSKSEIYVQNSTFETFGLAAIEALYSGCDLLISDHMGCKNLFSTLTDYDVINDVNDIDEISKKLEYLRQNSNNERLMKGFRKECVSHQWQLEKLTQIFGESNK